MMLETTPGLLGRPRKPQGRRALARVLREYGVLRTEHAVDVVLDVCDALVAAHENGIVHGQIAPHTVHVAFSFETGPTEVQIFVLSTDDSGPAPAVTPLIAPEQRDRERRIDTRVDVWALGALLVTMVTGRPPAAGVVQVPDGTLPRSLAAVVESCLATDPDRRPQTVTALAEAIASFSSAPPDRFAALAQRRVTAEQARIQRERLERRGLQDMPKVLDRLDDAALRRARGTETATISSISSALDGKTNERDLERLMSVVRNNTDEARLETAARLPSLIDVEDDDELNVPTTMRDEAYVPPEPIASPLASVPVVLALAPALASAAPPTAEAPLSFDAPRSAPPRAPTEAPRLAAEAAAIAETPRASRRVPTFVIVALAVSVITTVIGFVGARAASSSAAVPPAVAAAMEAPPAVEPTAQASAPAPRASAPPPPATIPTLAPSALPDAVLTVTPDALPSAARKR